MSISEAGGGAVERLAYTVDNAARAVDISRSKMWDLIKKRRVRTIKLDGRTLIRRQELERLIDGLERGS